MKPDFFVWPELARAVRKSEGFVFLVLTEAPGQVNRLLMVSSFFKQKRLSCKTHTLFSTCSNVYNRLSDIKVSENTTR